MKYRLVQDEGGMSEFDGDNIYPAMEVRGFDFIGFNINPRQRPELQNQPMFKQLAGPMWDGDAIRYEDSKTNERLSI